MVAGRGARAGGRITSSRLRRSPTWFCQLRRGVYDMKLIGNVSDEMCDMILRTREQRWEGTRVHATNVLMKQ